MEGFDNHLVNMRTWQFRRILCGGDNDNWRDGTRLLPLVLQALKEGIAIHTGHRQIKQNNGGEATLAGSVIHPCQRLLSIGHFRRFKAIKLKRPGNHISYSSVVVYYQHNRTLVMLLILCFTYHTILLKMHIII